jgi:hypothetical protein
MDFKQLAKAIENKKYILIDKYEKKPDLTVGDWDKMNWKQKKEYEKKAEN